MLVIIGTTTLVPSGDTAGRRGEGHPRMEDGMGNSWTLRDTSFDGVSHNGRKGLLLPGVDETREDGLFHGKVLILSLIHI